MHELKEMKSVILSICVERDENNEDKYYCHMRQKTLLIYDSR